MSDLWQRIRCRFFQAHRWAEKEVDYETAFECRVCRKRYFPAQPVGAGNRDSSARRGLLRCGELLSGESVVLQSSTRPSAPCESA